MQIRKWTRWAALGGAGGLAIASPALAQSTSLSIVDNPAVAVASSHYNLDASLKEEYQSNVAGGGAAVAALRGLKQSDYVLSPTLLVDIFRPIGRESIFLTGSTAYNFYERNHILSRENFNLSGGVNGQLSLCRATLSGAYARRQNDLQDITRTAIHDTYQQTSVGLNGACGRSVGFSPNFSITQTWSNNSLSQLQSSDYKTLGGTGGVSYQRPTFGNLSLFGQYQSTEFTNRILFFNLSPQHDGFDTYGGGVSYVRQLGARIQGSVSLSYTSVKPFAGSASFNGPTYGADVTFRASSRLMLHGSVTRDVQPSNVFDATYFLETKGLVEADYHLGSRLDVDVAASETDRTFKGPALVKGVDLRNDTQKSIYATVTYTLRKLYVALDLRNDQRTANVAGLSYPDNRIGVTAGARF